ncbi:MAG TPA: hypothetical protein VGW39_09400 [Chthoniobacterales bacterium]|nr:hypothetical protein [Chthoniobacterales bacterium]
MGRTTGTTGTNGFGFPGTATVAAGFMGITSAVAGGIVHTLGPVIGTIVTTIVVTMIATTIGVAIATMTVAGIAIRRARLPAAGDRTPLKG